MENLRSIKDKDIQYILTKSDLSLIKFEQNLIQDIIKNLEEKIN